MKRPLLADMEHGGLKDIPRLRARPPPLPDAVVHLISRRSRSSSAVKIPMVAAFRTPDRKPGSAILLKMGPSVDGTRGLVPCHRADRASSESGG